MLVVAGVRVVAKNLFVVAVVFNGTFGGTFFPVLALFALFAAL
jgi:hypothetical protein